VDSIGVEAMTTRATCPAIPWIAKNPGDNCDSTAARKLRANGLEEQCAHGGGGELGEWIRRRRHFGAIAQRDSDALGFTTRAMRSEHLIERIEVVNCLRIPVCPTSVGGDIGAAGQ